MQMVPVGRIEIGRQNRLKPGTSGFTNGPQKATFSVRALPALRDSNPPPIGQNERPDVDRVAGCMLGPGSCRLGPANDIPAAIAAHAFDLDHWTPKKLSGCGLDRIPHPQRNVARKGATDRHNVRNRNPDTGKADCARQCTSVSVVPVGEESIAGIQSIKINETLSNISADNQVNSWTLGRDAVSWWPDTPRHQGNQNKRQCKAQHGLNDRVALSSGRNRRLAGQQ